MILNENSAVGKRKGRAVTDVEKHREPETSGSCWTFSSPELFSDPSHMRPVMKGLTIL